MELPEPFNELTDKYRDCFGEIRQLKHFKELTIATSLSEKKSIAYLNSGIFQHVNQSNMNRFLSSKINTDLMFKHNIDIINSIEDDGILAIDDTILGKTGKKIEAAQWIYDHSKGKNVYGIQLATCALSGKYGIYPVEFNIYERKGKTTERKYISKIDLQIDTIKKCIDYQLNFNTVTGDS